GHVEALADRVDHLRLLRELQDELHGFVGVVPLPYQPENNEIPVEHPPTGFDALRTIAVSRIYLDNFDHITAYWVGLGLKLAQVAKHTPVRASRYTRFAIPLCVFASLRLCVKALMDSSQPPPKLRLAPLETAEELARRLEREQRAANLRRESSLGQSLAPFRVGSVRYL